MKYFNQPAFKKQISASILFLVCFDANSQQQDKITSIYNNETEIIAGGSITLKPGFYIPAGKTVRIYTTGLSFEKYVTALNAVSANQNYIRSKTFKRAGILSDADANSANLTTADVSQTVQYFDGLGRTVQTVNVQGSPGFRDLVQPAAYDAFGREAIKYQPYSAVSNGGAFRTDALANAAGQQAFYTGSNGIKNTTKPFSVTVFEASPLNRVLEQGAPGESWQPAAMRSAIGGRTVVQEYGTNQSDDGVKLWRVFGSGAATISVYDIGRLYKSIIKDENWVSGKAGTVDTYKDLEERVVLKRVWETETKSLSTYYVYDELGNLRYVLPPAVNENGQSLVNSFSESDAAFKNFIYGYHYDGRKWLTEKHVPGKGWEFMVYNSLDQVVLSQDSLLRESGKWNYSKYDALGRVTSTGLYNRNLGRSGMQLELSSDGLTNVLWESRAVNADGSGSEYSNVAFPRSDIEMQILNYYDNYAFTGNTFGPPTGTQVSGERTKGLLTGTKVNTLGTAVMLLTVNYYDEEGRVVQNKAQNHLNGTDVITNTYDFVGQLKACTRIHVANGMTTTIANRYDYDHMGRKLATWESINSGAEIVLSRLNYNELGQLLKKSVHGTDTASFLQSGTYAYNERGWTKSYSSDKFSYELKYQDGTVAQFNGNISGQGWGAGGINPNNFTYSYDPLNRLLNGTSTGIAMSEILSYDVMGNISTLSRQGVSGSYVYQGNKLKQITGENATGVYSWGSNGNVKVDGRIGVTLTYNQLNLPATVTKPDLNIAYTYDASGVKLKKVSNGISRDYINGIEYDGTNLEIIHTEEGLARRSGIAYSYEYNLTDHLGNVRLSLYRNPASGVLEVIQQTDYYPFGKANVVKEGLNKYLYNGKELQQELGQYDYGARFYDPVIGAWNVVDPLAEDMRRWSPYAYVFNNPLRFIDPDGMKGQDWFKDLNGVMQYESNVKSQEDLGDKGTYIGEAHNETTMSGGTAAYRKDGSIMYSNEKDAYQRIWTNTVARGREQAGVIGDKGVLVVPDYKSKIDEVNFKDYNYNFKNGNLIDPVTGKNFNTVATVHTHPDGSGPSNYTGSGYGDLGFASSSTPNKPVFVLQNNAQRGISFVISAPGVMKGGPWTSYNVTQNYPAFNINSIRRNQSLRNYALSIKFP